MNDTNASASPIKKQYIIIGVVIALVIAGISGFFMMRGGAEQIVKQPQEQEEDKVIPPVDSSVEVEVSPKEAGKKIFLAISKIPEGTESVDYEVTYETKDGGLQGVSSSIETEGKDSYEKDFVLGTCSTGGKCVYHQVSGPVKVSLKFNGSYGERIFEKEFELN